MAINYKTLWFLRSLPVIEHVGNPSKPFAHLSQFLPEIFVALHMHWPRFVGQRKWDVRGSHVQFISFMISNTILTVTDQHRKIGQILYTWEIFKYFYSWKIDTILSKINKIFTDRKWPLWPATVNNENFIVWRQIARGLIFAPSCFWDFFIGKFFQLPK